LDQFLTGVDQFLTGVDIDAGGAVVQPVLG
jgi:hypothetical protein